MIKGNAALSAHWHKLQNTINKLSGQIRYTRNSKIHGVMHTLNYGVESKPTVKMASDSQFVLEQDVLFSLVTVFFNSYNTQKVYCKLDEFFCYAVKNENFQFSLKIM